MCLFWPLTVPQGHKHRAATLGKSRGARSPRRDPCIGISQKWSPERCRFRFLPFLPFSSVFFRSLPFPFFSFLAVFFRVPNFSGFSVFFRFFPFSSVSREGSNRALVMGF